jgi:glycosyltransferase involved in cell wall biosynthesis
MRTRFDFLGKFPERYRLGIKKRGLEDVITIHGEQSYSEVCDKLGAAHFGLLILNDTYNYSFSTKFCEYLGQKKKMAVISNGGKTADFVISNGLGVHIPAKDAFPVLVSCIEQTIEEGMKINSNNHFDETVFSIERISEKLAAYLKSLEIK